MSGVIGYIKKGGFEGEIGEINEGLKRRHQVHS